MLCLPSGDTGDVALGGDKGGERGEASTVEAGVELFSIVAPVGEKGWVSEATAVGRDREVM